MQLITNNYINYYGMGGRRLAMYCSNAIKTPPNIKSITSLLFFYCISKLVRIPLLAPGKYEGY